MHGLEGLQDEGVTRRGRFNTVGEGGVDEVDKKGRREEGDTGVIGVVRGDEIGPVRSFPGTWTIFRSKSARSMSQRACLRLSAWGWWK